MKAVNPINLVRAAFTLIELMVVMAIIAIVSAMLLPVYKSAKDAANRTRCISNLHQIGYVYRYYADDNDGKLPTNDMLGRSSYRIITDPMSLPAHFSMYCPTNEVWLCPVGRKSIASNGVSYAWSRAQSVVGTNNGSAAIHKASTTFVVWDNYCYTLPSVFNVSELSSGPTVVSSVLFYFPHNNRRRVNWLYLDGHVENRAL